jgi:hypothetical protein
MWSRRRPSTSARVSTSPRVRGWRNKCLVDSGELHGKIVAVPDAE